MEDYRILDQSWSELRPKNCRKKGVCLVYGLVDPITEQIRYIGISSIGFVRPYCHSKASLLAKDDSYKAKWIRKLHSAGLNYIVIVLEWVGDKDLLFEAEIRWIVRGKVEGWPLTNLTDGGEGLLNPSDSTRSKIGDLSRARMANPEFRERVIGDRRGKPLPLEWRQNISLGAKGRKDKPETIEKRIAKQRGVKRKGHTEETKRKMSLSHTGMTMPAEARKKISDKALGRKKSDDHLRKIRDTVDKIRTEQGPKTLTDEHKEKIRIASQKRFQDSGSRVPRAKNLTREIIEQIISMLIQKKFVREISIILSIPEKTVQGVKNRNRHRLFPDMTPKNGGEI
jgi:hypothetical protein